MSWNGSGTFNRLYSWVADKSAGLDISSTRMDADTNDITSNGFGNCLTRDGQGGPTANLPMNNFKHTGLASGSARSDSVALSQVQDGLLNWTIATGTADAIVATYTPAVTQLTNGMILWVRAVASNATTTPTFNPNGLGALVITKNSGQPLAVGDIPGNPTYGMEIALRYRGGGLPGWELLNPSLNTVAQGAATTGDVKLTIKTSADSGWLLFDDGTFGSATSGSSNSNSALNQALFTAMFNSISDTNCPILTSGGGATTRAGQGTAAAAWAASCRMTLPRTLGRALAVAGTGSGLTGRSLGDRVGEESHTLTLLETPIGIIASGSGSVSTTSDNYTVSTTNNASGSATGGGSQVSIPGSPGGTFGKLTATGTATGITTTSSNTGGGAHNNMQPSTFLNAMIKQ